MLINEPFLDFTEHCIELSYGLVIAADKFLLNKGKFLRKIDEGFSLIISFGDLSTDHFFGWKKALILLDKMMPSVLSDTLDTDVLLISLTKEAKGLIMIGTKLIILA
jgi:hypothetical protein